MYQLHFMRANLRLVAKKAGVSVATASRALRGLVEVKCATRRAVLKVAQDLGYELPPTVVSKVLGKMRRGKSFEGLLAVVVVAKNALTETLPFHKKVVESARQRAAKQGFTVEVFVHSALSPAKSSALGRILRSRGVMGIIILHENRTTELNGFPWQDFPFVQLDYSAGSPPLHTVCVDHYKTLGLALSELASRGYRRPGLIIERFKDDRIEGRWSAAFRSHTLRLGLEKVDPLIVTNWNQDVFASFLNSVRPDVIIGHRNEIKVWIEKQSPETGFLSLNHYESHIEASGLDLLPELQGSLAVDAIITQIHNHEIGPPKEPCALMVVGCWVEGSTCRPPNRASPR